MLLIIFERGSCPPKIYICNEGQGWCQYNDPTVLGWGFWTQIIAMDHKLCNGSQSSFFAVFWAWNPTKDPLQGDSSRDLFVPDHWKSPTTFEGVTFSPYQKGHKKNHLVVLFFPLGANASSTKVRTWRPFAPLKAVTFRGTCWMGCQYMGNKIPWGEEWLSSHKGCNPTEVITYSQDGP